MNIFTPAYAINLIHNSKILNQHSPCMQGASPPLPSSFSNSGHTFSVLFSSQLSISSPALSIIPSLASCHSSDFSLHLHGNVSTPPHPPSSHLIPNPSISLCATVSCLVCPRPKHLTPSPLALSHLLFLPPLNSPVSFPVSVFLFFFCSVAFNSSRPLCAEWLMAPC